MKKDGTSFHVNENLQTLLMVAGFLALIMFLAYLQSFA